MLPGLAKIGILIDFKINQDFIAEVLCINREKPMTMCNGKCYLSEQLQKVKDQEEKQAPNSKKERLKVVYYFSKSSLDFLLSADCFESKINPASSEELYTSSFIAGIFRPPKLNLV